MEMDTVSDVEASAVNREYSIFAKLSKQLLLYMQENNLSEQNISSITGFPIELLRQLETMQILNIGYFSLIFEKLEITMDFNLLPKDQTGRGLN